MSKKYSFKELTEKAINNIEDDRAQTKELLNNLISYVSNSSLKHSENGIILAKYLETLQRSNEQLVKIVALAQKNEGPKDESISSTERDEIFQNINNLQNNN